MLCEKSVKVSDLSASIEKASRRYLVGLNVFDVFTSEKLGDKQSIAFKLSMGQNRTLSVEEVQEVMDAITQELVSKYNVEIR
ncbi:hypothetical protein MGH68_09750 [Erysipelothrix sp. D19-032]